MDSVEEDSPLTPCRICGKVGDEELMLIGRTWRRHPSCAGRGTLARPRTQRRRASSKLPIDFKERVADAWKG